LKFLFFKKTIKKIKNLEVVRVKMAGGSKRSSPPGFGDAAAGRRQSANQ
jgi:hypothetical protein